MGLMMELFGDARIEGRADICEGPLARDWLPFVYRGESEGGHLYYNSGGRSVVFGNGEHAYKINGVDPYGKLTARVAGSEKNLLRDVCIAAAHFEAQERRPRKTFRDKPFGVLTYSNVRNATASFGILNEMYDLAGIEPPCEVVAQSPIEELEDDSYQLLFKLHGMESDFRLYEFMRMVEKRLSEATREEIADRLMYVKRTFGRMVAWAGYAMGIMMMGGIVPTRASWAPQNFVLHNTGGGYGTFRVDHTSTENVGVDNAVDKFKKWMAKGLKYEDPFFPTHDYSFVPEAAEIAAKYPEFTDNMPVDQSLTPFGRVLYYYRSREGMPTRSLTDARTMMEAHANVFRIGFFMASDPPKAKEMAIPEEYFRRILE